MVLIFRENIDSDFNYESLQSLQNHVLFEISPISQQAFHVETLFRNTIPKIAISTASFASTFTMDIGSTKDLVTFLSNSKLVFAHCLKSMNL